MTHRAALSLLSVDEPVLGPIIGKKKENTLTLKSVPLNTRVLFSWGSPFAERDPSLPIAAIQYSGYPDSREPSDEPKRALLTAHWCYPY